MYKLYLPNRLYWFGHVQRMEENRTPKSVFYMNLETRSKQVEQEIYGKMK
jgi:hypothetical protein